MKIESLTISNFRSYQGNHNIEFSTDGEKKITLFLGDNGGGKTSLLNSIYWCLTGELTPSCDLIEGIKNSESKINNSNSQCYCEIKYIHNDTKYRLRRTLNIDNSNNLDMWKIDNAGVDRDIAFPDNELKKIIPRNIAKWFYYDAEAFTNLTLQDSKSFKDDLRKTLGFEMTDLALEYLEKARSKIIRRQSGLTTDEEINTTQSNINQIEETLPGLKLTFEGFEKEYQSMEFKIKNLSKKILDIKAAQGFQRDWDNENINKKNLDENAKVLEKKAALMQGEEFPSIFIYNKVKDFGDQLESKEKKGEIPSPWNKKILKIILNENKCICGEKLDSEKEKIINERFQDATTGEFNQKITLLGGASLTMENSFKNFSSEYTEHTKAIEKNDKKRLESETRLAEIKENLIKLDKKEVNDILNEQDDLATKKENSYTLFLQAKNFYNDKTKELIGLRNSLESMHKKVGLSQKIQKEINKIDLVIDYIKSESQKTEEKSIGIIERELNENIKGGFNKNYKASIDKKDYSIRLTKNGGQPVSKSSGEGEFLKYAFVSAILNLSKGEFKNEIKFLSDTFVSPLVIDAPFSGLGPGYKKQCIDSIYNASEQLILMMLPEVLNKGVGDKIKNNIGKKYVIFYSTTEKEWDRDISNIEYQGQEVPIVQLNQKITGSALAEI